MAAPSLPHKSETITFRIDPATKASIRKLADEERRPLGELMRGLVEARLEETRRREFAREARRESELIAAQVRNPESDEAQELRELEAFYWEDDFRDEWKA